MAFGGASSRRRSRLSSRFGSVGRDARTRVDMWVQFVETVILCESNEDVGAGGGNKKWAFLKRNMVSPARVELQFVLRKLSEVLRSRSQLRVGVCEKTQI